MTLTLVPTVHPQAATFDFVPLLFVMYIIYAIVTSLMKAVKQVQQPAAAAQTAPAQPQPAADRVRATLARRLAAARAAQSAAPAPASRPIAVASAPGRSSAAFNAIDTGTQGGIEPPAAPSVDAIQIGAAGVDFAALMASLPPAAQAVLASAVIGPCAAHRGGGHNPEDW